MNPEIDDDPADTEATSDAESGNGASAFGMTGGGGGEAVAALDVPDSCTNRYEVVAGDFWLGIAEKAGVELDALLAANGAENGTAIYPGSEVCLPWRGFDRIRPGQRSVGRRRHARRRGRRRRRPGHLCHDLRGRRG